MFHPSAVGFSVTTLVVVGLPRVIALASISIFSDSITSSSAFPVLTCVPWTHCRGTVRVTQLTQLPQEAWWEPMFTGLPILGAELSNPSRWREVSGSCNPQVHFCVFEVCYMKLLGGFVSFNCLGLSIYISLLRHLLGSCKNAFASPKLLLDWIMGKWPRHHGR